MNECKHQFSYSGTKVFITSNAFWEHECLFCGEKAILNERKDDGIYVRKMDLKRALEQVPTGAGLEVIWKLLESPE